jgi:hypothetical protein
MPLEPEELTAEMKLYNMIDKVVIVRGAISSDPKTWELYIQGKNLTLDTDRLGNMKQFNQQYLKAFDRPAPRIKLSRWPSLLEALAEDKATYAQAPEESRTVFIARQMLEIVCDREASDGAEEAFPDLHYLYTSSRTMKKSIIACLQKFFYRWWMERDLKFSRMSCLQQ